MLNASRCKQARAAIMLTLAMMALVRETPEAAADGYDVRFTNGTRTLTTAFTEPCTLVVTRAGGTVTSGWRLLWSGSGDRPLLNLIDSTTSCLTLAAEHSFEPKTNTWSVLQCRGGLDTLRIPLGIVSHSDLRLMFYPAADAEVEALPIPIELIVNAGAGGVLPPIIRRTLASFANDTLRVRVSGANFDSVMAVRLRLSSAPSVPLSWTRAGSEEIEVVAVTRALPEVGSIDLVDGSLRTDAAEVGFGHLDRSPLVSRTELSIRFHPGEIEPVTPGQGLDDYAFAHESLRETLRGAGITGLRKRYPAFRHEDVQSTNLRGEPIRLVDRADFYVGTIAGTGDVETIAQTIAATRGILHATANRWHVASTGSPPDDEYYEEQWGLDFTSSHAICGFYPSGLANIGAPGAWTYTMGDPVLKIAILDTGVNEHTAFGGSPRVFNGIGQNFVSVTEPAYDTTPDRHGTAVAAIAGALGNDGDGIAGVNWNAPIYGVKVIDASSANQDIIANGIDWCRTEAIPVLNMSFGMETLPSSVPQMRAACLDAFTKGQFLAAAMGNANRSTRLFPAGFDRRVYAVGASDVYGHRWIDGLSYGINKPNGSNYGSWIDLLAPGGRFIVTAWGPEEYYTLELCSVNPIDERAWGFGGTSAAVPLVSGVASLLMSVPLAYGARLLGEDVEHILNLTARNDTIGLWSPFKGWGRLDAEAALAYIDPASRLVTQGTIGFGGSHGELRVEDTDNVTRAFRNVPGLDNGSYECTRYRLVGTANLNAGYTALPVAWTRASGAEGWKDTLEFDYDYEVPWGRITAHPTPNQIAVETFVYSVPGFGWFPISPGGARVAFTAIGSSSLVGVGLPSAGLPLQVSITPNPATRQSIVRFELAKATMVGIDILDVSGRRVGGLRPSPHVASAYSYRIADLLDMGRGLPTGVYFVRLSTGKEIANRKLVVLGI